MPTTALQRATINKLTIQPIKFILLIEFYWGLVEGNGNSDTDIEEKHPAIQTRNRKQ